MTTADADTAAALDKILYCLRGCRADFGVLDRAIDEIEALIAEARRDGAAGARTPGTVEVCSVCWIAPDKPCGSASAYTQETGDGCPIRSRTASEGRE